NDLITLCLGLELQSLALYVVASFDRDSVRSTEAGLKYFVLGALASGMLLYGASLVYGFAGTTSFAQLAGLFGGGAKPSSGLIIGMVFVAVGLAFKVSAVPFHMWVPDVYEGAPTPVTAFFSVAPKMAALALAIFMFAMAGIPPTAGFFSKLYIFLAAIDAKLVGLAVIGVVTSVVGAFYYLRIVKVMYFDEPLGAFDRPIAAELKWVLVVTAVLTMFFILMPDPVVGGAEVAAKSLFLR